MYANTVTCVTEEMFYVKLDSELDQCPCRDALVVLGDFNAVTSNERTGCKLCIGPHGSGTRNDNCSYLLNLARSGFLVSDTKIQVLGNRNQRCTAGLGIAMPEG